MQTPDARSVGTATNLGLAAQSLLERFDEFSHGTGHISLKDLRAALSRAPNGPDEGETAVRFFIASPVARKLAGETRTSGLTKDGLATAARLAADPKLADHLTALEHDPGDRDGTRQTHMLLRDPGIPNAARKVILSRFDDNQLLALYGRPIVEGNNPQDQHDITAAFLYLIRMSWLGAAEAEAITQYKIPYAMLRDDKAKSVSYWDHRHVAISQGMLDGGTGAVNDQSLVKHIGTFAHESGHAVYDRSGLRKRFEAEMDRRHVTSGMNGVVNEAVAGMFQNRAHVAAQGYGANRDFDSNLVFMHDIEKNIASDQAFYGHYYHVDTAKARSQLDVIKQLVANDLIPFFQDRFGLIGDPQLTQGLPRPAR